MWTFEKQQKKKRKERNVGFNGSTLAMMEKKKKNRKKGNWPEYIYLARECFRPAIDFSIDFEFNCCWWRLKNNKLLFDQCWCTMYLNWGPLSNFRSLDVLLSYILSCIILVLFQTEIYVYIEAFAYGKSFYHRFNFSFFWSTQMIQAYFCRHQPLNVSLSIYFTCTLSQFDTL